MKSQPQFIKRRMRSCLLIGEEGSATNKGSNSSGSTSFTFICMFSNEHRPRIHTHTRTSFSRRTHQSELVSLQKKRKRGVG